MPMGTNSGKSFFGSFKLILLVVCVVLLSIVILQNRELWEVRFLWLSGSLSGVVLLMLTAAGGFVAGVTVALMVKHRTKP